MPSETIYERAGKWYWVDESWGEWGPHDTRDDAAFAQETYVAGMLNGEPPPGDPEDRARCARIGINLERWAANRPETVIEIPVGVCNEDLDDRTIDTSMIGIEQSPFPPHAKLCFKSVKLSVPSTGG